MTNSAFSPCNWVLFFFFKIYFGISAFIRIGQHFRQEARWKRERGTGFELGTPKGQWCYISCAALEAMAPTRGDAIFSLSAHRYFDVLYDMIMGNCGRVYHHVLICLCSKCAEKERRPLLPLFISY